MRDETQLGHGPDPGWYWDYTLAVTGEVVSSNRGDTLPPHPVCDMKSERQREGVQRNEAPKSRKSPISRRMRPKKGIQRTTISQGKL